MFYFYYHTHDFYAFNQIQTESPPQASEAKMCSVGPLKFSFLQVASQIYFKLPNILLFLADTGWLLARSKNNIECKST